MIIYHGSDLAIKKPEILVSDRFLDFGMGFYTTSNKEQATRWASKVSSRNKAKDKILSVYEFDLVKAKKELKVLEFPSPDEKWLNFVTSNRNGKIIDEEYDIVIGPVADDNVYLTVKLFETNVLSIDETLRRLKVEKLFDQILFHTLRSLEVCVFDHYEVLGGD